MAWDTRRHLVLGAALCVLLLSPAPSHSRREPLDVFDEEEGDKANSSGAGDEHATNASSSSSSTGEAGGHHRPHEDAEGTAAPKRTFQRQSQLEQQREKKELSCNVTGPCEACIFSPSDSACTTGFKEQLQCVPADSVAGGFPHQVRRKAPATLKLDASGEEPVVQYASCTPLSPTMSVAIFEVGVICTLGVSFPLVVWRKKRAG